MFNTVSCPAYVELSNGGVHKADAIATAPTRLRHAWLLLDWQQVGVTGGAAVPVYEAVALGATCLDGAHFTLDHAVKLAGRVTHCHKTHITIPNVCAAIAELIKQNPLDTWHIIPATFTASIKWPKLLVTTSTIPWPWTTATFIAYSWIMYIYLTRHVRLGNKKLE